MLKYSWHYILTIMQIVVDVYFASIFFKKARPKRDLVAIFLISLPIPIINGDCRKRCATGFPGIHRIFRIRRPA